MHDDAINDIGSALMQLRSAFKKHQIPVPDQLSYSSPVEAREAKKGIYSIPGISSVMNYRITQNSADMDLEICGVKLLWT